MNENNFIKLSSSHNDDNLNELKTIAFGILLEFPGIERGDWAKELIINNAKECVNVFGDNPYEVESCIHELWEYEYYDSNSGLEMTFEEWSETICNWNVISLYNMLVKEKQKTKKINGMLNNIMKELNR